MEQVKETEGHKYSLNGKDLLGTNKSTIAGSPGNFETFVDNSGSPSTLP